MNRNTLASGWADQERRAAVTYSVDSFANGIAFGQHRFGADQDPRDHLHLRIEDDRELVRLRSRYLLNRETPLCELERHLKRLSAHGILRKATIFLGTTTDPFLPFDHKFDASMRFLDLFLRYQPGLLVVQTRSPLVVIAMPVLTKLGKHCSVTIGLETPLEESVRRYTPNLPRVEERLKTAAALRKFGVEVSLQVGPVLPYGDWRRDAGAFAELLDTNADLISVRPMTDGSPEVERQIKRYAVAKALAQDRKFHWLRHDSAVPLLTALEKRCAHKLRIPVREYLQDKQVKLFG